MKSFKQIRQLLNEGEFGDLSDKKNFDPANPDVLVRGVGIYKMSSLKKNIVTKLEDIVERATDGDQFRLISELLSEKGILLHLIKAVNDVEAQLRLPEFKRKITLMRRATEQRIAEKKAAMDIAAQEIEEKKVTRIKKIKK